MTNNGFGCNDRRLMWPTWFFNADCLQVLADLQLDPACNPGMLARCAESRTKLANESIAGRSQCQTHHCLWPSTQMLHAVEQCVEVTEVTDFSLKILVRPCWYTHKISEVHISTFRYLIGLLCPCSQGLMVLPAAVKEAGREAEQFRSDEDLAMHSRKNLYSFARPSKLSSKWRRKTRLRPCLKTIPFL